MTPLFNLGDSHNFGKRVRLLGDSLSSDHSNTSAPDKRYFKPRSTYWEWLFFSKDSPFYPLLDQFKISADKSFAQLCLGLSVENKDSFSGFSKAIEAETLPPFAIETFGALLAYCYFFGIYDLHKDNLILNSTHLQVIDCEVVFGKMILPHEGLLLPYKSVPFERAACSKVFTASDLKNSQIHSQLIQSFGRMLLFLEIHSNTLAQILKQLQWREQKIRIIFRNTQDYAAHEKILQWDPPLSLEERVQMERGDIPYFFRSSDSPNVEFFDSETSTKIFVGEKIFPTVYERFSSTDLPAFIEARKVSQELLPHGVMFLAKTLGFKGKCEIREQIVLEVQNHEIHFSHLGKTFSAKI